MGRIREAKSFGACEIELERSKLTISPTNGESGMIGAQFQYSPDPKVAEVGGLITMKFRKTPNILEITTVDGVPILFKRKMHPFTITVPKRTVGFDPRVIQFSVKWNDNDGKPIVVEPSTEISDKSIKPLLFNFGRGMRDGGTPKIDSHSLDMNGIEYTPPLLRFRSVSNCFDCLLHPFFIILNVFLHT